MQEAKPVILTIFGITGDLSNRMLLPALYRLEQDNILSDAFRIIGTSRRELSAGDIKQTTRPFIEQQDGDVDESVLEKLIGRVRTISVNAAERADYEQLASVLAQTEEEQGVCLRRMFYLAVPPTIFDEVITNIGETGLDACAHDKPGRLLIEKPFGFDVDSARHLIDLLGKYLTEDQVYRIDHFLAKDTVQNVLYFRFHNPIVRDIWNSDFVDHVQITVSEDIDIEGRAEFYEQTGALRDMIQSHLLQLVALVTMKEPKQLAGPAIRAEREAALSSLKPFTPETTSSDIVRGQYEGYSQEVNDENSNTETFVALKLEVDNERWRGVPVYLRTGKAMERKVTEITLVYGSDDDAKAEELNQLIIRMHPNVGIALKLIGKKPGLKDKTEQVVMDYCYETEEMSRVKHDAYEKLLVDAMQGDQTLFPSAKEVMDSWQFIQPILDYWQQHKETPAQYKKGSWGPDRADDVLSNEPIGWIAQDNNICRPRISRPTE